MPDFESGAFNRALPPLRLLTPFVSTYFCLGLFGVFCSILSSRRFSRHPSPARDQAIDRRGLVFRSEMCVPHHHLERPSGRATLQPSADPHRPSSVYWRRYGGCNARYTHESSLLRGQSRTTRAILAGNRRCGPREKPGPFPVGF